MVDPPRRIAAAVAGAGVVLLVLGWYQISGQPTVPQQLPYLASATIPGAALLVVGLVLALRAPLTRGTARFRVRGPEARPDTRSSAYRAADESSAAGQARYWRVPDGRYLHLPDCPLLDGRSDAFPVEAVPAEADRAGDAATGATGAVAAVDGAEDAVGEMPASRACPLCRPDAADGDPR